MAGEIAIHRELASMQTSIEHLTDTMKSMAMQWAAQDSAATAGRKALYEKFEAVQQTVGAQLASLNLRVDRVVDTMEKVEPAVKKYEDDMLRQEGAKRLGKGLIAAMTAAAGGIGWGLHELIGYLKH